MPPTMKPGTIVREMLTLQRDLLNGLKISDLVRWSGDSEVRQLVLQYLAFGRIRWPKSNGKPQSAALNQGFTILHWSMVIKVEEQDGDVVTTQTWQALPELFKFDEPDDSDHYSVGFFAQIPSPFPQHTQPTFASSVAWPYVLIHYRSIEPFDWFGSESETGAVIIPDFTVSLQPY